MRLRLGLLASLVGGILVAVACAGGGEATDGGGGSAGADASAAGAGGSSGSEGGSAGSVGGQAGSASGGASGGTAGSAGVGGSSGAAGAPSCRDEVCNGLDDDCDGAIDEGDPGGGGACQVEGQSGVCADGTLRCSSGVLVCESAAMPSAEVCDGLDNNCNGSADEGDPGGNESCDTGEMGICRAGTTTCTGGRLECAQNVASQAETCNGLDDDCDGIPDNGFPGSGMPCVVPGFPAGTPCSQGLTNCLSGQSGCSQVNFASAEVCDGVDNDCNGTIDDPSETDGKVCQTGLDGVCAFGLTDCSGGTSTCVPDVQPGTQSETCDGFDNNCDGFVDNVPDVQLECQATHSAATNVASWGCTVGFCEVTQCNTNFGNCDGSPSNGCEASLLTAVQHCGGCGTPCGAGGQCMDGSCCTPTTCVAEGKDCGSISDGCGQTLDCGSCSGGEVCGSVVPNVCGAPLEAKIRLSSYWGSCGTSERETGLSPTDGSWSTASGGLVTSEWDGSPFSCLQIQTASTYPGTQLRVGVRSSWTSCSTNDKSTGWTPAGGGWSTWSNPIITSEWNGMPWSCLEMRVFSTGGGRQCRVNLRSEWRSGCTTSWVVAEDGSGYSGRLVTSEWDGAPWSCLSVQLECM